MNDEATALATALNPLTARTLTNVLSADGDGDLPADFQNISDGLSLDLASNSGDVLTIMIRGLNPGDSSAFMMTHLGRQYVDEDGNIDLVYRLFVQPNVALHNVDAVLSTADMDVAGVTGQQIPRWACWH